MEPTVVPPGLEAQAREGVDACPERAILIEER
jgi:ferredoxin